MTSNSAFQLALFEATAARHPAHTKPMGKAAEAATRRASALALGGGRCTTEVAAYGACLRASLNTLERGTCDAAFAALRKCVAKAAVKAAVSPGGAR